MPLVDAPQLGWSHGVLWTVVDETTTIHARMHAGTLLPSQYSHDIGSVPNTVWPIADAGVA